MIELSREQASNVVGMLETIISEAEELDRANPGGNAATIIEQAEAAKAIIESEEARDISAEV
jgi:hypothetical protein